jgi:hypothetical protein
MHWVVKMAYSDTVMLLISRWRDASQSVNLQRRFRLKLMHGPHGVVSDNAATRLPIVFTPSSSLLFCLADGSGPEVDNIDSSKVCKSASHRVSSVALRPECPGARKDVVKFVHWLVRCSTRMTIIWPVRFIGMHSPLLRYVEMSLARESYDDSWVL